MKNSIQNIPRFVWRLLSLSPKLLYRLGLGSLVDGYVLLLTTKGRKSGLPRTTPLQYELVDNKFYIASARGRRSDWYRNIEANPGVTVQVGSLRFQGVGQPVTDPFRIADFLELRLKRHPIMVSRILALEGIPSTPSREQLLAYASRLVLVIIQPGNVTGDEAE